MDFICKLDHNNLKLKYVTFTNIYLQSICLIISQQYHHQRCEFESHSGEVQSIQHYVIKFVSDLRQLSGFLQVLDPVSSTNKTDRHDITEILLKVALNTIHTQTQITLVYNFNIFDYTTNSLDLLNFEAYYNKRRLISYLERTTRFWNDLHQVRSKLNLE